ncbi:MAG: polysaccharide deacetylase 2 family uncharacterized protein YibQ [Candidatus Midichloriaceae bacterium]|jgi:polysaccharide deacetylase 2 family uncharacterized protein YibQ
MPSIIDEVAHRLMKKFSRLNHSSSIFTIFILLFIASVALGTVIYFIYNAVLQYSSEDVKPVEDSEYIIENNKDVALSDKPKLTFVVMNLGMDKELFDYSVSKLQNNITFGILPYSPYLTYINGVVRNKKIDSIINIPMETFDYFFQDNGPYSMLTNLSKKDNKSRLNMLKDKAKGFNGYYTSIDETFTDDEGDLLWLLEELKDSNSIILYNDPRRTKPFIRSASKFNMEDRVIKVDLLIDHVLEGSEIDDRLQELKDIADSRGNAIGVIRNYRLSIDKLSKWLEKFDNTLNYDIISLGKLISDKKNGKASR